jgi:hypothetical protein
LNSFGEPWKHCEDDECYYGIGTADCEINSPDIITWEDEPSEKALELERRIVLCVNALAGVPDEDIEMVVLFGRWCNLMVGG